MSRLGSAMSCKQRCIVCRSEIEAGATKCVECGSYQGFSRHVVKYSAVGAAVLALLPFGSIAISLWEIAFGKEEADIRAEAIRCDQARLEIAFSNRGGLAGIVTGVGLANTAELQLPDTFSMRPEDDRETIVVAPNGAVEIVGYAPRIAGARSEFPDAPAGIENCEYVISIETAAFGAASSSTEVRCDCPQ